MIDLKEMFFEDILTYATAVSITGDFYQKAIELANWFFTPRNTGPSNFGGFLP